MVAAFHTACLGISSYVMGDFPDAVRYLAQAEQRFLELDELVLFEVNFMRMLRLFGLSRLGEMNELKRRLEEYLTEAMLQGDRYAEAMLTRAFHRVWIIGGDPDRAEAELQRKIWVPPGEGVHSHHWYQFRAEAEYALYHGRAYDFESHVPVLKASMLTRLQIIGLEVCWIRGRVAIADAQRSGSAEPLQLAEKMSHKLRKTKIHYAVAWGHLLAAGCQCVRGNPAEASRHLAFASAAAGEAGMQLIRNVARLAQGVVDEEARSRHETSARIWLETQGVTEPDRLIPLIATGVGERPRPRLEE